MLCLYKVTQILPLFYITPKNISSFNSKMSATETHRKPKRNKIIEVPIHNVNRPEEKEHEIVYKTYGANFNSKKCKQKLVDNGLQTSNNKKSPYRIRNYASGDVTVDYGSTETTSAKISRKYLSKENERLSTENQELVGKLNLAEEQFSNNIRHLKEKIKTLQNHSIEVIAENNDLKSQFERVVIKLEECKIQVEQLQICKNCEEFKSVLEKCNQDYAVLKTTNKELDQDLNMLKTVVFRLNVQLENYQEKLRKHGIKIEYSNSNQIQDVQSFENIDRSDEYFNIGVLSESHANHTHTPISWGKVNSHTLGPLLNSYQETINEKEDIIHYYESELSSFTGKLKEIISENETLHKKLTEDEKCSKKLIIELDYIKKELKNTKEQNDLLIKKCALKQDKLEEVFKRYEQKLEEMSRDYKLLHEEYHKSRTDNAGLKEKNKSLIEAHDDFKNEKHNYIPVSVHSASVNECKKWYEELKTQYENEKLKMKETIASLHHQISDVTNRMGILTSEKAELENKIKASEKHVKKFEIKYLDLQHNLNEVQLSRSACRKQLHKAMTFAKDLVTEQESLMKALQERQVENKLVKRIGSNIAARMDSLKNQLKSVQKDAWQELTTVEQRIKEQDSLIENLKLEHSKEIQRLQIIVKEKEEGNILLNSNSSIPIPHYLLFRDKNINK